MAQSRQQPDVENLSIAERIVLVEQIWDSIVVEQESLEVTEAQQHELDRRLEAYQVSPDQGANWEDVKASVQGMTRPILFRPEAEAEMEHAYQWYEQSPTDWGLIFFYAWRSLLRESAVILSCIRWFTRTCAVC